MTYPGQDVLNLIPTVLDLNVGIARGGGWSLAIDVVDPTTGSPLTVVGTTATLTVFGQAWVATSSGARYTWDIPKATVDALPTTSKVGDAMLTVSDGSRTVVWAKGKATVI